MDYYNLFVNSVYLYLSEVKNKLEFGLPMIAGSYSIVMGVAVDFGILTMVIGFFAAVLGILEKGFKLYREYLGIKHDKAKAAAIMKELDEKEPDGFGANI